MSTKQILPTVTYQLWDIASWLASYPSTSIMARTQPLFYELMRKQTERAMAALGIEPDDDPGKWFMQLQAYKAANTPEWDDE